jgi:predicted transposase YbfD/YdcC
MDVTARAAILRRFDQMPDPRGPNSIHNLADMAVMAILAIICGADGWVQVEMFAKAKRKWLATFLDLSEGIPSHDTFGRVFALLDPEAFERCFGAWTAELVKSCRGKLVAVDGKAIRRSFTRSWDKSGMAHLVSAFVRENQTVFGQVAVADKSNEIEAIPRLLALLDIKGAVVSIDAMGTQRTIAEQIVKADAEYVLALKDNQSSLCAVAEQLMKEAELDRIKSRQATSDGSDGRVRYGFAETVDGDHGRIETRRVLVSDEIEALGQAGYRRPGQHRAPSVPDQPQRNRRRQGRRSDPRPLVGREPTALATGRELQRRPTPHPQGARSRKLFATVPHGVEPAQAGQKTKSRHPKQTPQRRLGS